jgi:hypothetical protein
MAYSKDLRVRLIRSVEGGRSARSQARVFDVSASTAVKWMQAYWCSLGALAIVRPVTVVCWHRAGSRSFWRWKSSRRGGRPIITVEIRSLIRGHEPGQPALGRAPHPRRTAQARHRHRPDERCKVHGPEEGGPSRGWRSFLCNHADGIASMGLFVVPTFSFRLLYGFLILRHRRRRIMWLGMTANPTAEWIARQLTEACGWKAAPDRRLALTVVGMEPRGRRGARQQARPRPCVAAH